MFGHKARKGLKRYFFSNTFNNLKKLRPKHQLPKIEKCHKGEGVRKVPKSVTYYFTGPLLLSFKLKQHV